MCAGDFDCLGNQKCLPGTISWAPPGTNLTFCDCEAVRTGFLKATPGAEMCSVLGPETIYLISSNLTLFTAAFCLLMQALIILGLLKRQKRLVMNDVVTTLLFLATANFLDTCFTFLNLNMFFQPLEHVHNLNGRKGHPLVPVTSALVILSQSLGTIAYSNIPLAWTEIVFRTKTFNQSGKGAWKIRAGVRFFQLLIFVTRIAAFVVEGSAAVPLGTASAIVGIVGVLVVFTLSRRWFVLLFKRTKVQLKDSQVLRRINILTDTVVVTILFVAVTVTVYFGFLAESANLQCIQGEVCMPLVFRDVGGYASLILKISCQHYCVLSLGFYGCRRIVDSDSSGTARTDRTESIAHEESADKDTESSAQRVDRPINQETAATLT